MNLVERLRAGHYYHGSVLEAAARIEQLESQLQNNVNELDRMIPMAEQLELQLAEREATIQKLWEIIDDIDTYGDMAKSDDAAFRSMVERRQKDRWKTGITTDGYTLSLPSPTELNIDKTLKETK